MSICLSVCVSEFECVQYSSNNEKLGNLKLEHIVVWLRRVQHWVSSDQGQCHSSPVIQN